MMKRNASILVTVMLVLAIVPSAFADTDSQASTAVDFIVDNTQLSVTVPTEMVFEVTHDGTFVCPSATSFKVTNGSIFPVHVSSIDVQTQPTFTLVTQADFSQAVSDDTYWSTMQPGTGTAIQMASFLTSAAPTAGEWNLSATGVEGDSIAITTAGEIKNIASDLSVSTRVMTIAFTVAGGSAA